MKRLILMRHAKSDRSNAGLDDHARPLNDRGRRAARAIGKWLQEEGYVPDEVLCSSAERTGQTLVHLGLDTEIPVRFTRALYLAEPEKMLHVLRQAEGRTVLILGHSGGIADMAQDLLEAVPEHPDFDLYPTAATLVADFDIDDWRSVDWGTGKAAAFIVPRDLPES